MLLKGQKSVFVFPVYTMWLDVTWVVNVVETVHFSETRLDNLIPVFCSYEMFNNSNIDKQLS